MAKHKQRLGRGLDALLDGATPISEATAEAVAESELKELPLDLVQRGAYQPRTDFNTERLNELADSIRAQGVVQPIVVRPVGEGRYEIVAGERRWRAAQLAGLEQIPAVIRDVPDQAAVALALIENIQRQNLNPLEEAQALQRLVTEFGLTHQEASEAVGRSRTAVTNLLRLLELEDEVKAHVERGDLEMGHARCLLALKGRSQSEAAQRIVQKGLSVRESERLVQRLQQGRTQGQARKTPASTQDPNLRQLQEELSERLGARVDIQHGKGGKGKVVIHYNSLDELDGILERFK